MDVTRYFDILLYYIHVCVPHFYDLYTLVGCWSLVYIRRIIYKFLNVCPFDYTAFAVSGKVGYPLTGLTTPVWWLITPTDRPKLVRNRCVIEVFVGVCVLSFGFRICCWYSGFCIGMSQISFFFSCWCTYFSTRWSCPIFGAFESMNSDNLTWGG